MQLNFTIFKRKKHTYLNSKVATQSGAWFIKKLCWEEVSMVAVIKPSSLTSNLSQCIIRNIKFKRMLFLLPSVYMD